MKLDHLTNSEICDHLQTRADLSPLEQQLLNRLILATEEVGRLEEQVSARLQIEKSDSQPVTS